jgi:hypothetical protein
MSRGATGVLVVGAVVMASVVVWATRSSAGPGAPPSDLRVDLAGGSDAADVASPVVASVGIDLDRSDATIAESAQRSSLEEPEMSPTDIWARLNDKRRMAELSDIEQAKLCVLFARGISGEQWTKAVPTEDSALQTLLAEIEPGKPIDEFPAEVVASAKELVARHRREWMEAAREATRIHEATLLSTVASERMWAVPKPDAATLAAEAADRRLLDLRLAREQQSLNEFRQRWMQAIGRPADNASVRTSVLGSQFSRAQYHVFWSDVDSPDWFAAQRRLDQVKARVKSERADDVNRRR